MTTAYIGLGSNLSNPKAQVRQAAAEIAKIKQSSIVSASSLYLSKPMGPQDQNDYINAVLALKTELTAIELLDQLQAIENAAGRVRKDNRWGARILDLDIILFGDEIIENSRLTVPHYGMTEREFVLYPLAEIAPDLILPSGQPLKLLLDNVNSNDMLIQEALCF